MDINSYRIFLTLVSTMNFHRASEELFISQQALSAHISRMEKDLGAPLFDRKPTLRLTRAGETFKVYAEQILASENTLRGHFADITHQTNSIMYLAINHQRYSAILTDVINDFQAKYPNVSLCLYDVYHFRPMDGNLYRPLENMKRGIIDIEIGQDLPAFKDLKTYELVEEPVFCVVSKHLIEELYPEDYQERVARYYKEGCPLAELNALPTNLPFRGTTSRKTIDDYYARHNLAPHVKLECVESTFLVNQALTGTSLSVVAAAGLYRYFKYNTPLDDFHIFQLSDMKPHIMSLCFRDDILQPEHVLYMIDLIREEFRKYAKFMCAHGIQLKIPE